MSSAPSQNGVTSSLSDDITMLLKEGVPSPENIRKLVPSEERRRRGPYVMIECFQKIPCDPCVHACRFGAILQMDDIDDIPRVDLQRCTGCGACVAACPGLAIFVVDETYSEGECLIAIPYEFLPLPQKGEELCLLDRRGEPCGKGYAERVIRGRKPEGTSVVWVRAPKDLALVARNFRVYEEADRT